MSQSQCLIADNTRDTTSHVTNNGHIPGIVSKMKILEIECQTIIFFSLDISCHPQFSNFITQEFQPRLKYFQCKECLLDRAGLQMLIKASAAKKKIGTNGLFLTDWPRPPMFQTWTDGQFFGRPISHADKCLFVLQNSSNVLSFPWKSQSLRGGSWVVQVPVVLAAVAARWCLEYPEC